MKKWTQFKDKYPDNDTEIYIKGSKNVFIWGKGKLTPKGVMSDEFWRYVEVELDNYAPKSMYDCRNSYCEYSDKLGFCPKCDTQAYSY